MHDFAEYPTNIVYKKKDVSKSNVSILKESNEKVLQSVDQIKRSYRVEANEKFVQRSNEKGLPCGNQIKGPTEWRPNEKVLLSGDQMKTSYCMETK